VNQPTDIYTDDIAELFFNPEPMTMAGYSDDTFLPEAGIEEESARYSNLIRELTEFESRSEMSVKAS